MTSQGASVLLGAMQGLAPTGPLKERSSPGGQPIAQEEPMERNTFVTQTTSPNGPASTNGHTPEVIVFPYAMQVGDLSDRELRVHLAMLSAAWEVKGKRRRNPCKLSPEEIGARAGGKRVSQTREIIRSLVRQGIWREDWQKGRKIYWLIDGCRKPGRVAGNPAKTIAGNPADMVAGNPAIPSEVEEGEVEEGEEHPPTPPQGGSNGNSSGWTPPGGWSRGGRPLDEHGIQIPRAQARKLADAWQSRNYFQRKREEKLQGSDLQ